MARFLNVFILRKFDIIPVREYFNDLCFCVGVGRSERGDVTSPSKTLETERRHDVMHMKLSVFTLPLTSPYYAYHEKRQL